MAQRCQLIQPAPLQLSLRILQQQRYGTVKSTGKYFPFTTFRQLIAHTRLTFILFQSGGFDFGSARDWENERREYHRAAAGFPSHRGQRE